MELIDSQPNSENDWLLISWQILNPFMTNVPILGPLKTPDN